MYINSQPTAFKAIALQESKSYITIFCRIAKTFKKSAGVISYFPV